jgi:hypothetical protein
MIADYFTKPLQGLIFQQLREIIMGNADSALPTDRVGSTTYQTGGIPAVPAQQESRSVLRKEGVIDPSPPTLNILFVSNPSMYEPTSGHVRADAHTCTSRVYGSHISPSNRKEKRAARATPATRWADVARK